MSTADEVRKWADEIRGWFVDGKRSGKRYLIVVRQSLKADQVSSNGYCYPVYAETEREARRRYDQHSRKPEDGDEQPLDSVLAVFNLARNMEPQIQQPYPILWESDQEPEVEDDSPGTTGTVQREVLTAHLLPASPRSAVAVDDTPVTVPVLATGRCKLDAAGRVRLVEVAFALGAPARFFVPVESLTVFDQPYQEILSARRT